MFHRITIPTKEQFLAQWFQWTHGKVSRKFKKNKERIPDVTQTVRLRLLSKDFVGRWFFKHLTGELVDKTQAEYMLGGIRLDYIYSVSPIDGKRDDKDSVWKVSDLLSYAKFNHKRFYYSIQSHTIDTPLVLTLLGYGPGDFNSLKSLYFQNRLRPAELTEHICSTASCEGCQLHVKHKCEALKSCHGCEHGREVLARKKLTLADDWMDPASAQNILELRWNDSQLEPFLRNWHNENKIKHHPLYVMRTTTHDVNAGLLSYAQRVIDNETNNEFKRMGRHEDLDHAVLNDGLSPVDTDVRARESHNEDEDKNKAQIIIRDPLALEKFSNSENKIDVYNVMVNAHLQDAELDVIQNVDLGEMTVPEYAKHFDMDIVDVNSVRNSALRKMRSVGTRDKSDHNTARIICKKYGCSYADMLSDAVHGPCVIARSEFFAALSDQGISIHEIATKYGFTEDRVASAINRAVIRDQRVSI